MPIPSDLLHQPVTAFLRREFVKLRQDWTASESLDHIRGCCPGGDVLYFYVVDSGGRLTGVLPARALLTAAPDSIIAALVPATVISLPDTATVMEAGELLVARKLLALPVVDKDQVMLGVLELAAITGAVVDVAEKARMDALFEAIGVRVAEIKDASPARAFRFRFPWLLATIASGTACAFLASAFELTLAKSIVLAFYITLVLGLGESVSIQSMTVAIQSMRANRPDWAWYGKALRRESGAALLLGLACGTLVALLAFAWRGDGPAALVIGSSIVLSLSSACFFGLTVPTALHALRWDPKIAAGPITLAITDIFTLLFYFGIATWWL